MLEMAERRATGCSQARPGSPRRRGLSRLWQGSVRTLLDVVAQRAQSLPSPADLRTAAFPRRPRGDRRSGDRAGGLRRFGIEARRRQSAVALAGASAATQAFAADLVEKARRPRSGRSTCDREDRHVSNARRLFDLSSDTTAPAARSGSAVHHSAHRHQRASAKAWPGGLPPEPGSLVGARHGHGSAARNARQCIARQAAPPGEQRPAGGGAGRRLRPELDRAAGDAVKPATRRDDRSSRQPQIEG